MPPIITVSFALLPTSAALLVFLAKTLPDPPGNVYGCCLRNTWPTRLHGTISSDPPHCHTRNEISAKKKRMGNKTFSWIPLLPSVSEIIHTYG